MSRHVALLRAINLGPRNRVAMADLRDVLTRLGFGNVQSLLQSGNLVFDSDARSGAHLEDVLEREGKRHLGLETDWFVRSAREWQHLIARNPFPAEAARDPAHLLVVCLKAPPAVKQVKALQSAITGPEVVRAVGQQAYIVYPEGIGRSRVTSALIERMLGASGTGRNWNTVLKLGALI